MDDFLQPLKEFFAQPSWFLPAAVSVAMQLILTNHVKPFLPKSWMKDYRDGVIWLVSSLLGVMVFVPTRWAWLTLNEESFGVADFVLSVMVALVVIGAMPWIYSKLPEGFRDNHSYEANLEKRKRRNDS